MLEQKSPQDDPIVTDEEARDTAMILNSYIIEWHESYIDPDKDLYLFTFNPNPEELPDADFQCQHEFALGFVTDFLKGCAIGLACVETTQMGNPHYHGWYQLCEDPLMEMRRITAIKVMQKYAPKGIRITKPVGNYRINSYTEHGNALHYYKKDLHGSMARIAHNPITRYTESTIDWFQRSWWFDKPGKKCTVADLENKISNKQFYQNFYKDSQPAHASEYGIYKN